MQLWIVSSVALLLRLCTGLHPYSGYNDPPKYGDYEAQRHWMEITTNTPASEWYGYSTAPSPTFGLMHNALRRYIETPNNNLSYWPLDYPPLSGYQSWVHGQVISRFDPKAVELGTSHGYETYYSKLLMRWSVVWSDLLVFFPAAVACAYVYTRLYQKGTKPGTGGGAKEPAEFPPSQHATMLLILTSALLQPALVIVDHGHFQYNCISLGLAAGAAASIMGGLDVVGSVLFCLSLNHKQMSLFYAPAFFAHLLGKCLQRPSVAGKVAGVAKLGITVITTFAVCWAPFLTSKDMALQVLGRILPVKRGLYEDYVANFWCASSVAIKWKLLLSQPLLMKLCAAAVLTAAAPSMVHQMARPSPRGFLLCLVNSAMAFFMFSYQVHEKSILLPLMPLTLLAPDHPYLATYLPIVASFSMFPLLERDGLTLAYIGCILAYLPAMIFAITAFNADAKEGWNKASSVAGGTSKGIGAFVRGLAAIGSQGWLAAVVGAGMFGLHVAKVWLPAPVTLPWLYDRAFISLSFVVFAAVMVYLNATQWALPSDVGKPKRAPHSETGQQVVQTKKKRK